MSDTSKKKQSTLEASDIVTERKLGRRSALGLLGSGAASGLVGAVVIAGAPARAEAKASDSDPSDPAGRGRTGFTDRDSGASVDGAGRGVCAERGHSDSDPNDQAGRGRGPCH